MRYLDTYVEKIRTRGDDYLADYVKRNAHRIGERYLWDMVLNSTEYLKEIPIIVVEHENYKKMSLIGKYISSIKNSAYSSFLLKLAV